MPLLQAADSLMSTDPQAAYQILCSIEDGTDMRMNRQERACFLLLMAEADYRCDEPMVRDTAVGEAVEYFHKSGQKGLCARALIMRAAVRQEMADTLLAVRGWWNSVPYEERSREKLGVIHSLVDNICRQICGGSSSEYMAALDSIGRGTGAHEAARVHIALAEGLSVRAAELAAEDLSMGLALAREEGDREAAGMAEEMMAAQQTLAERTMDWGLSGLPLSSWKTET